MKRVPLYAFMYTYIRIQKEAWALSQPLSVRVSGVRCCWATNSRQTGELSGKWNTVLG